MKSSLLGENNFWNLITRARIHNHTNGQTKMAFEPQALMLDCIEFVSKTQLKCFLKHCKIPKNNRNISKRFHHFWKLHVGNYM